jgi:chromosome segregation ATPase
VTLAKEQRGRRTIDMGKKDPLHFQIEDGVIAKPIKVDSVGEIMFMRERELFQRMEQLDERVRQWKDGMVSLNERLANDGQQLREMRDDEAEYRKQVNRSLLGQLSEVQRLRDQVEEAWGAADLRLRRAEGRLDEADALRGMLTQLADEIEQLKELVKQAVQGLEVLRARGEQQAAQLKQKGEEWARELESRIRMREEEAVIMGNRIWTLERSEELRKGAGA